jgi:hypothetical protein
MVLGPKSIVENQFMALRRQQKMAGPAWDRPQNRN